MCLKHINNSAHPTEQIVKGRLFAAADLISFVYHSDIVPVTSFHVAIETVVAHIQFSIGIKFDISVLKFTGCCIGVGMDPVYGLCQLVPVSLGVGYGALMFGLSRNRGTTTTQHLLNL